MKKLFYFVAPLALVLGLTHTAGATGYYQPPQHDRHGYYQPTNTVYKYKEVHRKNKHVVKLKIKETYPRYYYGSVHHHTYPTLVTPCYPVNCLY